MCVGTGMAMVLRGGAADATLTASAASGVVYGYNPGTKEWCCEAAEDERATMTSFGPLKRSQKINQGVVSLLDDPTVTQ